MNKFTISNIKFEFTEYSIEFSFQKRFKSNKAWGSASLQLPNVGDSQQSICDEDYDPDNEIHNSIFCQLEDFYFSEFKNTDCAAASSLLSKLIIHVEEVNDLYVAFSVDSKHLIKESTLRDYYNKKSLFDFLNDEDYMISEYEKIDIDTLINQAEKSYFETLSRHLENKMDDYFKGIDLQVFNSDLINICFDEISHEFMKDEFNQFDNEYQEYELSQNFYEMFLCDIRFDFENKLRDLLIND